MEVIKLNTMQEGKTYKDEKGKLNNLLNEEKAYKDLVTNFFREKGSKLENSYVSNFNYKLIENNKNGEIRLDRISRNEIEAVEKYKSYKDLYNTNKFIINNMALDEYKIIADRNKSPMLYKENFDNFYLTEKDIELVLKNEFPSTSNFMLDDELLELFSTLPYNYMVENEVDFNLFLENKSKNTNEIDYQNENVAAYVCGEINFYEFLDGEEDTFQEEKLAREQEGEEP